MCTMQYVWQSRHWYKAVTDKSPLARTLSRPRHVFNPYCQCKPKRWYQQLQLGFRQEPYLYGSGVDEFPPRFFLNADAFKHLQSLYWKSHTRTYYYEPRMSRSGNCLFPLNSKYKMQVRRSLNILDDLQSRKWEVCWTSAGSKGPMNWNHHRHSPFSEKN
jgi:hypothetical protein